MVVAVHRDLGAQGSGQIVEDLETIGVVAWRLVRDQDVRTVRGQRVDLVRVDRRPVPQGLLPTPAVLLDNRSGMALGRAPVRL